MSATKRQREEMIASGVTPHHIDLVGHEHAWAMFSAGREFRDEADRTRTYVGPEYLTNVKEGETEPPLDRPWEFYLFCHRDKPNGEPFIHTITGESEEECAAALARFVDRDDVTLLEARIVSDGKVRP